MPHKLTPVQKLFKTCSKTVQNLFKNCCSPVLVLLTLSGQYWTLFEQLNIIWAVFEQENSIRTVSEQYLNRFWTGAPVHKLFKSWKGQFLWDRSSYLEQVGQEAGHSVLSIKSAFIFKKRFLYCRTLS